MIEKTDSALVEAVLKGSHEAFRTEWVLLRASGVGILRGGREHADMGGAICSVAAGHGRNWGHGAVTACYAPLLLGTRELAGAVVPLLEIAGGKLPEDVLALVRPPVGRDGDVVFFNGGAEAVDLRWRRAGDGHWQGATLAAGQQLRSALRGSAI